MGCRQAVSHQFLVLVFGGSNPPTPSGSTTRGKLCPDLHTFGCRGATFFGLIAQLGERRPCTANVAGSIPVGSTVVSWRSSTAEQLPCKQQVAGSIPIASSRES